MACSHRFQIRSCRVGNFESETPIVRAYLKSEHDNSQLKSRWMDSKYTHPKTSVGGPKNKNVRRGDSKTNTFLSRFYYHLSFSCIDKLYSQIGKVFRLP